MTQDSYMLQSSGIPDDAALTTIIEQLRLSGVDTSLIQVKSANGDHKPSNYEINRLLENRSQPLWDRTDL